jgi:hypothetical protein
VSGFRQSSCAVAVEVRGHMQLPGCISYVVLCLGGRGCTCQGSDNRANALLSSCTVTPQHSTAQDHCCGECSTKPCIKYQRDMDGLCDVTPVGVGSLLAAVGGSRPAGEGSHSGSTDNSSSSSSSVKTMNACHVLRWLAGAHSK